MKKIFKPNWKRKLVVLKFTLQRGYAWCHLPVLAIIGAGVLKPYFPGIHLWQLALIAFSVFVIVGFIDKQIKLLHEEQSYITEQNPTLMRGLFETNGTKKIRRRISSSKA